VISDRAGRTPKNWQDYDVFSELGIAPLSSFKSSDFTPSDWNGISCFWYPGASFTSSPIADGAQWWSHKVFADNLNLVRAVPLHIWVPT